MNLRFRDTDGRGWQVTAIYTIRFDEQTMRQIHGGLRYAPMVGPRRPWESGAQAAARHRMRTRLLRVERRRERRQRR